MYHNVNPPDPLPNATLMRREPFATTCSSVRARGHPPPSLLTVAQRNVRLCQKFSPTPVLRWRLCYSQPPSIAGKHMELSPLESGRSRPSADIATTMSGPNSLKWGSNHHHLSRLRLRYFIWAPSRRYTSCPQRCSPRGADHAENHRTLTVLSAATMKPSISMRLTTSALPSVAKHQFPLFPPVGYDDGVAQVAQHEYSTRERACCIAQRLIVAQVPEKLS